jgi:hypothetical protein
VVDSIELRCGPVVLAIALAVAACSSSPRASQAATDGTFNVAVSVPSGTHHASEALDVVATLTYQGPAPSIAVDGDDVGLVHFTFKQLDGARVGASVSDLMCAPQTTLLRGTAATFRPGKSIGWVDYDPNASFDTQPSADPDVHLSAGRWQIIATAQIWDSRTCYGASPDHTISTPPLVLDVVP